MNILLLSQFTRMGASSRLRTMQYIPALQHAGIEVHIAPFFNDAYLHALYHGSRKQASIAACTLNCVRQMRERPAPDLIWLEKEALPWIPWLMERALLPNAVPFVVDYDDAVFHRYDRHRSPIVRRLLGRKLDKLMASATLVTARNRYLANRAKAAGSQQIEIVPTVVDVSNYTLRTEHSANAEPVIGWIGTPSTWAEHMTPRCPCC